MIDPRPPIRLARDEDVGPPTLADPDASPLLQHPKDAAPSLADLERVPGDIGAKYQAFGLAVAQALGPLCERMTEIQAAMLPAIERMAKLSRAFVAAEEARRARGEPSAFANLAPFRLPPGDESRDA